MLACAVEKPVEALRPPFGRADGGSWPPSRAGSRSAFAARFEVLAQRIGAGLQEPTDIATCTADEVALHMVVDRAEELEDEGFFHGGWIDALEQQDDDDFVSAKDMLFMDFDVLLLFDPSLDGVEDPDSEGYQVERFENLHPRD